MGDVVAMRDMVAIRDKIVSRDVVVVFSRHVRHKTANQRVLVSKDPGRVGWQGGHDACEGDLLLHEGSGTGRPQRRLGGRGRALHHQWDGGNIWGRRTVH